MKKLLILLNDYPYSFGEYPFINTELSYLLECYEISILCTSPEDIQTMPLDSRIKLHHCKLSFGLKEKVRAILGVLFSKYGWQEISAILKEKKNIPGRLYDMLSFYGSAMIINEYVRQKHVIEEDEEAFVYSYWFNDYCMAFLLRKKRHSFMKVVSRIHGYDLYDERNAHGRQPFRKFMDQNIDRLFFIAENGKKYYLNKWKDNVDAPKYKVAFIGTENLEPYEVFDVEKNNSFTLVSCSNLIPLKRVGLIIDALTLIEDVPIRWVHFGTGSMQEELEEKAREQLESKENIEYCFKGFVDNDKVLSFYKSGKADCFITTSSTEGCPISIQEAMSYCLPIIATAVGEIPNMIKGNGELLSDNPIPKEIKNAIMKIYFSENIKEMREISRKLWEEKYDAHKNAKHFLNELERVFD